MCKVKLSMYINICTPNVYKHMYRYFCLDYESPPGLGKLAPSQPHLSPAWSGLHLSRDFFWQTVHRQPSSLGGWNQNRFCVILSHFVPVHPRDWEPSQHTVFHGVAVPWNCWVVQCAMRGDVLRRWNWASKAKRLLSEVLSLGSQAVKYHPSPLGIRKKI